MKGELSGGYLVFFILYLFQFSFYIDEVGEIYIGFMEVVGVFQKVFEFIDREFKIQNSGIVIFNEVSGEVEFQNVFFVYFIRLDIIVLDSVSFSVKLGEVIVLVGFSGGGKSICISFLEYFYELILGEVLIDLILVKNFDYKYLYNKVVLVGQEFVLFVRLVKENIIYGFGNDVEID